MIPIDPVHVVKKFLDDLPDIPLDSPTGDMTTRGEGDVTIYLEHSGGFRAVRDRMDRADVEYSVYHPDRGQAIELALTCRRHLLETLPGYIVAGAEILDVEEISSPRYFPDSTSREHMYGGEITLFYCEAP